MSGTYYACKLTVLATATALAPSACYVKTQAARKPQTEVEAQEAEVAVDQLTKRLDNAPPAMKNSKTKLLKDVKTA
jgi:hypothetical protein